MAQWENKKRAFGLFVVAVLAEGLPVWFNANHNHANDATLTLAIPLVLALVCRITTKLSSRTICFAIVAGASAALIIKIFIDWHFDPTSHNLLPFEIIINGILITCALLAGLALGSIVQWLRARRNKSIMR